MADIKKKVKEKNKPFTLLDLEVIEKDENKSLAFLREETPEEKEKRVSKKKETRQKNAIIKELLLEALSEVEVGENGYSKAEEMCRALVQRAITGDTKAFEIVRDSIGQTPQQVAQMNIKVEVPRFVNEIGFEEEE